MKNGFIVPIRCFTVASGKRALETDNVTAERIKRQIPQEIRIRTYVVIPVFLFVASAAVFKVHDYVFPFYLALLTLLPFFTVNHALDWGYQFAFDDNQVYQRAKGWRWFFRRLPWYVIRYDDMSRIETIFAHESGLKRHFVPFDFILIYARSGRDGDNVVLYPPAFNGRSLVEFLDVLRSKRPELFPINVLEYMENETAG